MKRIASLFCVLLLAAVACSQPPTPARSVLMTSPSALNVPNEVKGDKYEFDVPSQQILGSEKPVALGELVDLSMSPIKEHLTYHVACSYDWTLIDLSNGELKIGRPYDGGIFFAAGIQPKRILVLCHVTHLYVVPGAGPKTVERFATKTIEYSAVIVIGDSPTPPGPTPPGPAPTPPSPDLPDGKFKLAKAAYDMAYTKAPVLNRAKAAAALETSFRGVASAIAAGTKSKPEEVLKDTQASNRTALTNAGVDPDTWKPFFTELQNVTFSLHETGGLNAVDDFKDAWNEIADGLNAVK